MIEIYANSKFYGNNGQYIARITGRDSKFTYRREFIGRKSGQQTTALIDEPGLYEEGDIDKKGRKDPSFRIVAEHDGKLVAFYASEADIMAASKRLDAGESIAEMIEVSQDGEKLAYRLRTKGEAKKASVAVTLDGAIEACWIILASLPEREAKKVLAALKLRITPKPTATEIPAEPLQMVPTEIEEPAQ